MIRVLFVGHSYVISGGFQRKLDTLAGTGEVEVGLLVPHAWKSKQWGRTFEFQPQSDRIKVFVLPAAFKGREGAYFFEPLSLLRSISEFQPDVIQVEQEVFALSSFELAVGQVFHKRPLIFFGWENIDRARRFGWVRRGTRQLVLRSAQAVICGNHDNERLIRGWGYNGRTWLLPQFGVNPPQSLARRQSDTSGETLRVAFIGALTHQKGVDVLLDALSLLKNNGTSVRLTVCGVGPLEDALAKRTGERGLERCVKWLGFVPASEIPTVLEDVDVLVLPARTLPHAKEQFGLVLPEAMRMGIPVVGSSSGSIPDVIGRADLVFPEGDASRLADILDRLMKDLQWRNEVSEYCLARVHQKYTHGRIVERLLQIYREVLSPVEIPDQGALAH